MDLIQKFARHLSRSLAMIIIVPLFSMVSRLIKLRFTPLHVMRIGSLAPITHFYVAQRKLSGVGDGTVRLFFGALPCNRQLFEMWGRILPIVESRLLWAFYQYANDILERLPTFRPLPMDKGDGALLNCYYLTSESGGVLSFNEEDESRGRELLDSLGIGSSDWFVCFQGRDSVYQKNIEAHSDTKSHRNAPIESYLPAAEHITKLGGFAIRTGHMVSGPLPNSGNPKIIDYALTGRSDFGDIYLLGKNRFFLGSSTGTQHIPPLFGVPVATAHLLCLMPDKTGRQSIYCPKLIQSRDTGEFVSYSEIFASTFYPQNFIMTKNPDAIEHYENEKYTVIDNSADDVLDLCKDMLDQIEGIPPHPDALKCQKTYQDKFFRDAEDVYEYGPHIGPRFALKYRHLIEAN